MADTISWTKPLAISVMLGIWIGRAMRGSACCGVHARLQQHERRWRGTQQLWQRGHKGSNVRKGARETASFAMDGSLQATL
jgi:hypothetical protein